MTAASASDVLEFWFGAPGTPEHGQQRSVWFRKSHAFDDEVRSRFLDLYEQAEHGKLDSWHEDPQSLLALIIVLDQFPRNMFRGEARSFATDALALTAAQRMVAEGWDRGLPAFQRAFAYLPFEHAEDLAMQEQAVALFERDPELAEGAAWAGKHRSVIARFGRFPHRNAVLGRESTPNELEFLKQPGSSF
jgi:uncharacterized protein (DUF924 family)